MKAVTYARYSSDNQREESIEAQQDAIQKYAIEKGYTIVKEYSDHALSGRESEKRAEFLQMIEDAKQGFFDTVLIHKQNRFARNRGEAVYYKGKLKRYGVKVIAVAEDFGDGPVAVLIESILEGFAEYQSLDLATETMKGLMVNAKHCKFTGGRALYGYRVNEKKEYEINQQEAEIVRFVFDKIAAGWSYADIVNYLNDKGIRKRNGKKWGRNIIFDMVRNERYMGVFTFNQYVKRLPNGKRASRVRKNESEIIRIPGGMPAIVTEETFKKVQAILSSRKIGPIRRNNFYLLTGFIFCGLCGSAYTGSKASLKHAYYVCSRKKNIMDCSSQHVPQKDIEALAVLNVEELVKNIDLEETTQIINDYIIAESKDIRSNREKIKAEIASLNQKVNNILDVIESGLANEAVKARLHEHSERIKQLEGQLSLVPKEKNITVNDTRQKLAMLDPENKTNQELREIFKMIGLKIYVFPDRYDVMIGGNKLWHNVGVGETSLTLCQILADMLK